MSNENPIYDASWEKNHEALALLCEKHPIDDLTPDSTVAHEYDRDKIASFNKDEWEQKVWAMEQIEMKRYYEEYRNIKEYLRWLKSSIDPQASDDQTKSVAAQLHALQIAPKGKIVVLGGGHGFNIARLVAANITSNEIVSTAQPASEGPLEEVLIKTFGLSSKIKVEKEQDPLTYLQSLADNSVGTVVLDWSLSRVKDPLVLFDQIHRVLVQDGIYVHTDRKAFEKLLPSRFGPDGIARIPERRTIHCRDGIDRKFWVAKQFVRDLPGELVKRNFQVIYDTQKDPSCIYDIAVAKKSSNPTQSLSTNRLLDSTLPHIQRTQKFLLPIFA